MGWFLLIFYRNVGNLHQEEEDMDAFGSLVNRWLVHQLSCPGMAKFRNADPSHRLERLASAEAKLTQLQSSNDGDGICALVRRVAGWLAPPRHLSMEGTKGDKSTTNCEDLQSRIRKLLISALESLDLTDVVTFQAVEAAVNYIRLLGDSLEAEETITRSRKDWNRLRSLVHWEARRGLVKGEERATSVEGVYHPSKKVKGLLMVSAGERKVQLKCTQCPQIISSNWFWTHPGTGEMKVIVPAKGQYVPGKCANDAHGVLWMEFPAYWTTSWTLTIVTTRGRGRNARSAGAAKFACTTVCAINAVNAK